MTLRGSAAVSLVGLVLCLPTGCGSATRVVVLQHPSTQQTVQCRVDPWGSMDRTRQIEACVAAHTKAGYQVVGDSQ
jgi:hypothetical protein